MSRKYILNLKCNELDRGKDYSPNFLSSPIFFVLLIYATREKAPKEEGKKIPFSLLPPSGAISSGLLLLTKQISFRPQGKFPSPLLTIQVRDTLNDFPKNNSLSEKTGNHLAQIELLPFSFLFWG